MRKGPCGEGKMKGWGDLLELWPASTRRGKTKDMKETLHQERKKM